MADKARKIRFFSFPKIYLKWKLFPPGTKDDPPNIVRIIFCFAIFDAVISQFTVIYSFAESQAMRINVIK